MSQKKREPIDMSPRAVALRLDDVRDLYRLTQYLARFRPVDVPSPDSTDTVPRAKSR
jgi:hypothetical protein